MRRLIVNADDLGLSPGVTAGIFRAHREGIVTSASLMVDRESAPEAAAWARLDHPRLGLGLHLDLGEWAQRDGGWEPVRAVVDTDDAAAVANEIARQLGRFRELVGRDPTHLDSHQHVHRHEPVRSLLALTGKALRVPVRHHGAIRYCGGLYDHPTVDTLTRLIAAAADAPATELACHPAERIDIPTDYGEARRTELASLCDPSARRAVEAAGLTLTAF